MEIAESIVRTLKKSTRTVLSKYTISTRGPKQLINPKRDIGVFYDNDKLNMQTFDSDDRFESFMLLITFKKMNYTEAHKEFEQLKHDIFQELYLSETFTYKDVMTVGDIDYSYSESGLLNQAAIQLLFNVEEDYTQQEHMINEVDMRGDIID